MQSGRVRVLLYFKCNNVRSCVLENEELLNLCSVKPFTYELDLDF